MRWLAGLMAIALALPAAAQRVTIDTGALQGKSAEGVSAFLGIPFAADASGANRWRAPQPATKWRGVREATRFGPDCTQNIIPDRGAIGPWTWEYLPQGPTSEDCLSLNVWASPARRGAKLPVLVWFHGGGFTGGSTSVALYDGAALAKRGIVVVTVNYRVGAYGFLAHPALSKEAGSSGNYALLDQVAGLEWVKRNVVAFGGDPAKVTIMGQSAGAASVHALMASPKAKGLFRAAIAQSGSRAGISWPSLAQAEAQGESFANAAGATTPAELRALTPEQIAAASRAMTGRFAPATGTPVFPSTAVVSDVPVLTGFTADEGSAFAPPDQTDAARTAARDRDVDALLGWFAARKPGSAPAYGYLWTWAEPGSKPQYRAFHSAELAYVFGTLHVTPERPFTDRDREIARLTGDYWANFVKAGDPNGPGLAAWPRLDSGRLLELGTRFAEYDPARREPVTILVSIDGFRADYLDRGITPTLSALADAGVRAAMRPSFPSKTFPNHYAIVTGLRPDRNGIVANNMEDPRIPGKKFTMSTMTPVWWNEAEPIWVSAEKAGIRTGTMYWPGSNARIRGLYPSIWQQFNHDMPDDNRVDALVDWLRRPAAKRPQFLTLYFNTVDDAGHDFGPDAKETNDAVKSVDAEIGRLRADLAALGQPANLIVVADHGMAPISEDRVIDMAKVADPSLWRVSEDGPYASFFPMPGKEKELEVALRKPHPHMQCWPKAEIPARFHYGTNPRIPPWFCLAEISWQIRAKPRDPDWTPIYGNHGWDHDDPLMRALFVASGPAFAQGKRLESFDNVDVYALIRTLIGMPPAKDVDGSDAVFTPVLIRP